MHFSGALIISLLFYHRVVSSEDGTFLREKILLDEETMLGKFSTETNIIFNKYKPWHVTVLGVTVDQFRKIKSLLESFQFFFVGKDGKKFCSSREFSSETPIIYFLASLEKEYITKVMESLSNCKKNHMYFIYDEIDANDVDIELVLRVAFEKIHKLPIFIHDTKKSLKFYGYGITPECSRKAHLIVDWKPGVDMERLTVWQFRSTYSGCPISVGTMHNPPWMDLVEDSDGVVRNIGGLEGKIISTIAQKMNFTPVVENFKLLGKVETLKTPSIVSSCAARKTAIGIAQLRPKEKVIEDVDMSRSYAQECTVWCVPRIIKWKRNIMISEFSWRTWVLIGLTFLASFVLEKIVRSMPNLNRGNANNSGCCRIILDLIGSTLGNPIVYRPLSMGGKVLLIIYICYSTVITTAYKTSLSSILTADNTESSLVDIEGIIKANLTIGGNHRRLSILMDQIEDNEFTPELIKRYVFEANISKALRRISYEKNFAYLTSLVDLNYHKHLLAEAGEHVSLHVIDKCILTHSNVIFLPNPSPFAEQINQVLKRLASGGFLDYWIRNNSIHTRVNPGLTQSFDMINTEEDLHTSPRYEFYMTFYIYGIALTFCILIFLGELIVHKYKLAGGF